MSGYVVLGIRDQEAKSAYLFRQGFIYETREAAEGAVADSEALFPGRVKHVQVIEIGKAS